MKTTTKNVLLALLISIPIIFSFLLVIGIDRKDRTSISPTERFCEHKILKEYLETNPNATVLDYANRIQKDCWKKGGDKT